MSITEKLNWRYATKRFDSTKKLSEEQLNTVKEIIKLSPSSFGLQPYKVLLVKNPEIREKLKEVSWGQSQVTDASDLLVFVRNKSLTEKDVDEFVDNIVSTRGVNKESLKEYEGMIKYAVGSYSEEQKAIWVDKQIYLALGNLLTSLSVEGIDACPMEGLDKSKYDEILGLTDTTTVVVCPIGIRHEEDGYQHYKKVRKPLEQLFETI
jgi:nitroreductase